MDNSKNKEFHSSLDLTNDELEGFVPELLKGLWELGSMPGYIMELIGRNNLGQGSHIIDLGCGKGAVLVKLAAKFAIKAVGVDRVPGFIEEANIYAKNYGVSDRVQFKRGDILETIPKTPPQDIVIYGYDSAILGDLANSIRQLSNCLKPDGYILLEYTFAEQWREGRLSEHDMLNSIVQTGYRILDRIDWDRELLKETNRQNTAIIKKNVQRLVSQYPEKTVIFEEYLRNQLDECEELENDYICTTVLLGR